jgi:hypothetical protein
MERDNAAKILQTLVDGIDPATGEPFPASSPYQRADIVRALFVAVQALGNPPRGKTAASQEKPGFENAGRPWSQEEDTRLGRAFDAGKSIEVLSEEHKRSRFAIEARLVKLGRIEDTSTAPRFPLNKNAPMNKNAAKKNTAAERSAGYSLS